MRMAGGDCESLRAPIEPPLVHLASHSWFHPGYSIVEELHSGAKTVVYRGAGSGRASRHSQGKPFNGVGSASLWREFEVLEFLKESGVEGVIRALSVEEFPVERSWCSRILDKTLDRALDRSGMPLSRFLSVAADLARTLGELHRCGSSTKTSPSNIYHDPISRELPSGTLGSPRLSGTHGFFRGSLLLEGSPALHLRNRPDVRTGNRPSVGPLPPLGVSFYEMLTDGFRSRVRI